MRRTVKARAILRVRTGKIHLAYTGKDNYALMDGWEWVPCTITYDDGKPKRKARGKT